ncbi:Maf family protein [Chitinolyticbacter meiyuanensis]|uniref:Maf family protein n=1 Tax=Chitinolyticbacter meiyuanensis TaxID=682798 RepID=UPI0011E5A6B3|nr:Maf family nucleotide pyrophosphatase [Chitinolyticbacter meiyuanensis]
MEKQTTSPQLVLASTSRYRKDLLARLGLAFDCAAPGVDETPQPGETASATSLRLAIAKAEALAPRFPGALLIGSDQVALLDGTQLGKPGSHEQAAAQLTAMRGRDIVFHTAVALHNSSTGQTRRHIDITTVTMRDYSDAEIEAYLRREQPYDCAGSAKVEGLGSVMITAIANRDPSAIIGLPLLALCEMLRAEGVALL